jgi:hypothetical protein
MPDISENHGLKHNADDLLLPLLNRVGATQKISSLISELKHPNMDWKAAVDGLRAYLFDYIFDIAPYSEKILPVIFYYLYEATARMKVSSLRAGDTFFDRYIFILKNSSEGNGNLGSLKPAFDYFCAEYMELMILQSGEDYYFDNVNMRVIGLRDIIASNRVKMSGTVRAIDRFLVLQYKVYIKRSIVSATTEINRICGYFPAGNSSGQLVGLLRSVSAESYIDRLIRLEKYLAAEPPAQGLFDSGFLDFSQNTKTWERICQTVKQSIEEKLITEDAAILNVLSYLVRKSNEGRDRDLQLYISRGAASICHFLVGEKKIDLLKGIIDLIMPVLISEIEKGGNYVSAFSTINIVGKIIIESRIPHLVDYFIDMLVKAKFCFPEFGGIASDWSVVVNSSHMENIRTWMKLIEIDPPGMRKLAASLIVNLKLGGIFLKDTDIFQRDISRLLRSDYGEAFYIIISLAAVFPAFYHDIGATGDIRAFTEKIDTNHQMDDLVHFVRKQVHVESSSRTVYLIQRIMEFWMTGDKSILKDLVPDEVFDNLDGIFRMINLDSESAPSIIFAEALKNFPGTSGKKFWDLLNYIEPENFIDFINGRTFQGVSDNEKAEALDLFRQYFRAKSPAEMTKMLEFARGRFTNDLKRKTILEILYEISDDDFRKIFQSSEQAGVSAVNIEKFITFLHVYRMLFDKYNFSVIRGIEKLEQYRNENLFEAPDGFFASLRGGDILDALESLLDIQRFLKNNVLLSTKHYEPLDTIEFKRHIAFGIPSMYGSYKEKKFDTLKVFFHMNLIRVRFFERIIESLLSSIKDTIGYNDIKKVLKLFFRTFMIDGLANQEMAMIIDLLETPKMKVSQFRDMVTHLLNIHGEISDQFNETFKHVCREAISNIGIDRISRKYIPRDNPKSIDIIIDRFLRDQIMQSPLLQLMDNLLLRLKERLAVEIYNRGDYICLNDTDSAFSKGQSIFSFIKQKDNGSGGGIAAPVWKTGSKAGGLLFATCIDGINVPEGYVLSSELYKRIKEGNINNPRFRRKLTALLQKNVDVYTRNRFANSADPILLSVRSGAVFSMPGVMDTITNVGITQEILDYYAAKDQCL